MRIEEMRLEGWKGQNGTIPIGPMNVVFGANRSGKTAILTALQFAIEGTTPFGRSLDAAAALTASSGASIALGFDDRSGLRRTISIGRNSATSTVVFGNKKGRAATGAIEYELGSFAPMFDLRRFWNLSADKRRAFVLQLCFRESIGIDAIRGKLLDDPALKETGEICDTACLRDDASVYLSGFIAEANAQKNAARQAKDQTEKAIRELTGHIESHNAPAKTIEALKAERDELQQRRDALMRKIEAAKSRKTRLARLEIKAQELRKHHANKTEHLATLQAAAPPQPQYSYAQAVEAYGLRLKQEGESKAALHVAIETHDRLTRELADVVARVKSIEDSPWSKALELMDRMTSTRDGPSLMTIVDSEGMTVWNELRTLCVSQCSADLIGSLRSQVTDINSRLVEAKGNIQTATQEHETHKKAVADAYENREAVYAIRKAHEEWAGKLETAEREVAFLASEIINVDTETAALKSGNSVGAPEDLTQSDDRLAELNAQIETKTRVSEDESRIAACKEAVAKHTANIEAYTACEARGKEVRDELMKELVAPLVQRINRFIGSLGWVAHCSLEDFRGKPIFDICATFPDRSEPIPYDALCGAEKAIIGAAIAYGLIMLADPPLKLLLIEAAELDPKHLKLLMDGLSEVTDDLSNIFLATYILPPPMDGWNVIDVSQAEAIPA